MTLQKNSIMNPIKKHLSLFSAILGLLPVASPAAESSPQADKKPNIIFILLDDAGTDEIHQAELRLLAGGRISSLGERSRIAALQDADDRVLVVQLALGLGGRLEQLLLGRRELPDGALEDRSSLGRVGERPTEQLRRGGCVAPGRRREVEDGLRRVLDRLAL